MSSRKSIPSQMLNVMFEWSCKGDYFVLIRRGTQTKTRPHNHFLPCVGTSMVATRCRRNSQGLSFQHKIEIFAQNGYAAKREPRETANVGAKANTEEWRPWAPPTQQTRVWPMMRILSAAEEGRHRVIIATTVVVCNGATEHQRPTHRRSTHAVLAARAPCGAPPSARRIYPCHVSGALAAIARVVAREKKIVLTAPSHRAHHRQWAGPRLRLR